MGQRKKRWEGQRRTTSESFPPCWRWWKCWRLWTRQSYTGIYHERVVNCDGKSSNKGNRQIAKETKRKIPKELTKIRQNWYSTWSWCKFPWFPVLGKKVMIMVIYRKDSTEPGIYGPICIFPMLCTLFGNVFVGDVVSAIGPKDTFDGSAQGKSPFVDDVDKGLVVGRVESRTGVQVERVENEVVLRFEGNNN